MVPGLVRVVAWVMVAAISFVSGGFAIPIGFSLSLPAVEVYLAASIGSLLGLWVFLLAGDGLRRRLTGKDEPDAPDPDSWVGRSVERFGAKGLGIVGPIVPGVTASVVLGLAMGLPRAALGRWMSIGIAIMFALYCGGLWLLIDVVGLD